MKYRLSLLTLGALLPAICFSQGDFRRGYIIKNNGDSLSGFVDYRVGAKSATTAYYRPSKRDATTKFTAQEIKVYGFRGDKRFESINISRGRPRVFAEVLVRGSMSLYRHKGIFYVSRDSVIKLVKGAPRTLQTERGTYVQERNSYIGTLNLLMDGCGLRADETRLNEGDLIALIQNYNRCKGSQGEIYKEALPASRINFNVFTGLNMVAFSGNFEKNSFRKDRAVLVGGSVDLSFPKSIDRFYLTLEANYTNYVTHGYIETGTTQFRRTDYFIDASFVRIPLGIRYNFFHDTRTPYIKAGLVQLINLGSDLRIYEDLESNSVITSSEKTIDLERSNGLGYWCAVGLGQAVRGPLKVFVEIRVEKSPGFGGHRIVDESELTTTSLLLGIRL